MHLRSGRETASFTLGVVSVIVWVVAEIPQIITNYRVKSTDGLSITFLVTWMIGDLFNLFGCMLEPATLPTRLYMAALYTIITVVLVSQTIYYGHIYPQSKYKRQLKVSALTFLFAINLHNSLGKRINAMVSNPKQQFVIYVGRKLFQIRRGHVEGLNPLMFLFALIGNATYVASILVSSVDWSTIRPNLPWLVDAGGYFNAVFIFPLLDRIRPVE